MSANPRRESEWINRTFNAEAASQFSIERHVEGSGSGFIDRVRMKQRRDWGTTGRWGQYCDREQIYISLRGLKKTQGWNITNQSWAPWIMQLAWSSAGRGADGQSGRRWPGLMSRHLVRC